MSVDVLTMATFLDRIIIPHLIPWNPSSVTVAMYRPYKVKRVCLLFDNVIEACGHSWFMVYLQVT